MSGRTRTLRTDGSRGGGGIHPFRIIIILWSSVVGKQTLSGQTDMWVDGWVSCVAVVNQKASRGQCGGLCVNF